MLSLQNIQKTFKKRNIEIISRINDLSLWNETNSILKFVPHYMSNSFLDFQNEYFKNTSEEFSFIALKHGKPIFNLPLFYNHSQNHAFNFEEYLQLPHMITCKGISDLILSLFKKSNVFFINPFKTSLYQFIKYEDYQTLNINLGDQLSLVSSNFRKSYKSLVKKKTPELEMKLIYKKKCFQEWSEFIDLHKFLAGKMTRSIKSWNLQHKNIYEGNGLFVFFKKKNKMVSGSFFDLAGDDIKYSVSCTHPDYLEYSCNHKSLYEAIKFGIEHKFSNLYLGGIKTHEKNEKLKNIFFFKKGFCSSVNLIEIFAFK